VRKYETLASGMTVDVNHGVDRSIQAGLEHNDTGIGGLA
jgi:hypothetical protein